MFATNPAMCAYAETDGDLEVLVSLGTGEQTRPLPYEQVKDWGRLEWARPVLDVVFDGTADAVDFQLESLLGAGYVRLQTPLDEASDELDDVSPENLEALEREAQRLIAARDDELDRLCAQLTIRLGLARHRRRARPAPCAARAGAPRATRGPP